MIHYLYNKLVAAGFSFTIFMFVFISQMNMFELSQSLNNPMLWFAFYGYGIICSFIIDGMIKVLPINVKLFILYCFFGFIPFILFEPHPMFILIAGTVGVFAAILFYIGLQYISKKQSAAVIFSIILPLLFLFVSTQDFTKKENWNSKRYESSFEATFTYFNGEHKIPIDLNKGEKITYIILFQEDNDGGWGNHFENEKGDYMGMDVDGDYLSYDVQEDGNYYIVVGGNMVSGNFTVKWNVE